MQAVREGFLVAAVKGKYQLGPALLSIIKFLNSRADKLPTYDNAAQCSAMTGIPVDVITQARKIKLLGPGGDNRIALATLLQVMFESRGENWKEMTSKFDALEKERMFKERSGVLLPKSDVAYTIKRGLSGFFRALDQRSNVDLPPALVGLDAAEMQRELVKSDEELKKNLLREWSLLARNGEAKDAR